jgi:Ca-activated chloride channel family protein
VSRACVAVAVLLLAAVLQAQPSFRAGVDLVTVPLTVTGRDGTAFPGELSAGDFRVFEDGVAQNISVVSHEPRPISLCILLDSSPSMASGRQALATRTIDTMLKALAPDDEASVLFFSSTVKVALPWTRGDKLRPIPWLEWRLSLGTALIDAMKVALRQVEQAHNPQPVIVVVSDGGENASGTTLPRLVATRRQGETLVYAIDTVLPLSKWAPPVNRAFTDFLPELVGDSGGTVFTVRSPEAGESAGLALIEELRSQYTLGYVPKMALNGKYRLLRVESTRAGLTVRHRGGYLATGQTP